MNVIGFDDGPFPRDHRGDVLLVGTVCSGTRLDGVVTSRIRRDGSNSTQRMIRAVQESQFAGAIRAVLLQGIAVGGFNVVDVHQLSDTLGVPALVVMRRVPDMEAIRRAVLRVPGGRRKWSLIESAGAIEPLASLWVQRVGLSMAEAGRLVRATTLHGHLPEALRLAHLIAGGVVTGRSRGRA
jgi:endonuclease V-like protein UPF0215 family